MSSIAPIGLGLSLLLAAPALGQTLVAPYDVPYSLISLGFPPGVPQALGGISFKPGSNNRVYINGGANGANGAMYEIGITRDINGFITGWDGTATFVSTAAYNDGGLCEIPGSGGTMAYVTYSNNTLGQILPGAAAPARIDPLNTFGISGTTGTCAFVPPGLPGAGNFVIATYGGSTFYTLPLTPDSATLPRTYTPGTAGAATVATGGGPEGIVYVPLLSPIFESTPTMLVCMYGLGKVVAYDVGPEGLPIVETARDFVTGLSGAEGGCLDPVTNTFLFSTFGGSGVIAVPGFNPPACGPADVGRTGGIQGHDGRLDNNDFVVFIQRFFNNDMRDDVGIGGGFIGQDGILDNNDFIAFITMFFEGC